MTKLTKRRPFWETPSRASDHGSRTRPVCVAMEPECIVLRLKGTRRVYRLPWLTVYEQAVMAAAKAAYRIKQQGKPSRRMSVSRGKIS